VINGKDAITYDKLDHSWFVGLVGPKNSPKPLHAIAVLVENGGSGGRTAGPIANQIIRALQAEGYLPGDANVSATGQSKSARDEPEPAGEEH
jgi:penicillin-binding protein 2